MSKEHNEKINKVKRYFYVHTGVHPGENRLRKRTFTKFRDLKTDPKIKYYNVIFHIRSAANEFTWK